MPAVRALLRINAIVMLACIGAAVAGLAFTPALEQVTAVWPASGVALAAYLICGTRVWPGVLIANLFFHVVLQVPAPDTAELAGGSGLRRSCRSFRPTPDLRRRFVRSASSEGSAAISSYGYIHQGSGSEHGKRP